MRTFVFPDTGMDKIRADRFEVDGPTVIFYVGGMKTSMISPVSIVVDEDHLGPGGYVVRYNGEKVIAMPLLVAAESFEKVEDSVVFTCGPRTVASFHIPRGTGFYVTPDELFIRRSKVKALLR